MAWIRGSHGAPNRWRVVPCICEDTGPASNRDSCFNSEAVISIYAPIHGVSGTWRLGAVLATEARSPILCVVTVLLGRVSNFGAILGGRRRAGSCLPPSASTWAGGGATTYHPLRTAILLVVDLMLVPWRVHSKIRLAGPLHAAHLPALVTVLA
jgi:hypothetical protein